MTQDSSVRQPISEPGIATAEGGMVLLDGPDGIAVTLTAQAAQGMGQNLIAAAQDALKQSEAAPDRTT